MPTLADVLTEISGSRPEDHAAQVVAALAAGVALAAMLAVAVVLVAATYRILKDFTPARSPGLITVGLLAAFVVIGFTHR